MANLLIEVRAKMIARMNDRMNDVARKLSDGGVSSFDEYKKHVGKVAAYREAIEDINTVFKEIVEDGPDE